MTQTTNDEATESVSRRDEILTVAARVIAERGIKQATVRDIGEAAGILSGSLYYHFPSKDRLVLELLLPYVERTYEASSAICQEHSGLDALREMIRDSVVATAANPHRAVIMRNEARLFAELPVLKPINDVRTKVVGLWFRAIEQGIRDGNIRPTINPDVVARAILDGTLGASRWFDGTREADPEAVTEALADFYVAGLQAD